jgi:hypothetical protein
MAVIRISVATDPSYTICYKNVGRLVAGSLFIDASGKQYLESRNGHLQNCSQFA